MRVVDVKILLTFFIANQLVLGYTPKKEDKFFEVLLDRFEIEKEDKSISEFNMRVRKSNNQRLIFGYMTLHVIAGNNFSLEIKSLKKQGGEYRYMAYSISPTPLCDLCENDDYCYADLAKNSDLPSDIKNNCPLVPGNYSANGITCSFDNIPKVISSGDYAMEFIFSKDNNIFGVYKVYASVNNI